MNRRRFLEFSTAAVFTSAATAGLVPVVLTPNAFAQAAVKFPEKPITLIMPLPAGTGMDIWHRALAEAASKSLGQPIFVDNRAGGTGTLGPATMAANAKPDGYTISMIGTTIFRFPFMQKTTYDPLKDFTYIMNSIGISWGVYVRADSPFKTFGDLVEFARANPGKLTYATVGAASSAHLGMEQIALQAVVKFTHVPFKGGPENTAALEGGHVMAAADGTGLGPMVDAGKFRLLVLWTAERNARWPTVPTLKEAGYNFVIDTPIGLAGPKGMDPAIVKRLHDAFRQALDDPRVVALAKTYDFPRRYLGPEDYPRFVAEQVAIQKDLVTRLGMARKE